MLRVVLDTNVFISALCFPENSLPSETLMLALTGKYELCTSSAIILETAKKLEDKFGWESGRIRKLIKLIGRNAKIAESSTKLEIIKKDPDDNKILECAVESNAHFIVTGDKHLLELVTYNNINIITPAAFINIFKE